MAGEPGAWVMIMCADDDYRLRDYTAAKQQVAELVRRSKQTLHDLGIRDGEELCQALLVKLAEDRFNLVVVGQFKRGKSSLMNAVVGRALLPTGLLPLTSAITALCYGPSERAILRRKGWTLQPEIPLGELEQYVTERGNPGNEKGLIEARVELPLPFLRGGLYFIDTPGIGSARQENTATTYEFLPEADAIVFVTSVEAPLSEAEQGFLQDISRYARKLFVVVNKVDLVADGDRFQTAYAVGFHPPPDVHFPESAATVQRLRDTREPDAPRVIRLKGEEITSAPGLPVAELDGERKEMVRKLIADMLDARMLYSALVDADHTATQGHFDGDAETPYRPPAECPPLDLAQAIQAFEAHLESVRGRPGNADSPMRALRETLLEDCLAAAAAPTGLFTLSAPTGSGKTLAMLAFALHHARHHGLRRIVVVLPYLNIIDQTAKEYREIFSERRGFDPGVVQEHHSLAEYGRDGAEHRPDLPGDPEHDDAPNQAINHAATAVEGAATIAVAATGTIPALGFIHEDSGVAWNLDIADLYRTEVTIPVAFAAVRAHEKDSGPGLERQVRRLAAKAFRDKDLIASMIDRIKEALSVNRDLT